jgi:dephospho-CoA kinase
VVDNKFLFVGVTGLPGSGKDEFIGFLWKIINKNNINFLYYSLSDELREEVRKKDLPVMRSVLREVAHGLRKKYGRGVLAKLLSQKILKELNKSKDFNLVVVIDAIRNPEEVNVFKKEMKSKFFLVAITAPIELLIERLSRRARYDESKEVIKEKDKARVMLIKELGEDEPSHGHNVNKCIFDADYIIDNSGTIEEFYKKIIEFTEKNILNKF